VGWSGYQAEHLLIWPWMASPRWCSVSAGWGSGVARGKGVVFCRAGSGCVVQMFRREGEPMVPDLADHPAVFASDALHGLKPGSFLGNPRRRG
jgi:hypothetical protein